MKAFLKPLPAQTPAEALKTFETIPGFHLEPVATEPLVHSPVAAAFDEDGTVRRRDDRLPVQAPARQEPLGACGCCAIPTVTAGSTRAKSWPKAHVADRGRSLEGRRVRRRSARTSGTSKTRTATTSPTSAARSSPGFGTENEQGGVNNLTFGLDHKIYGSSSFNGGKAGRRDDPKAKAVDIDHADFRFDPTTLAHRGGHGTVQFGTTFDDFGDRFLCSESRPCSTRCCRSKTWRGTRTCPCRRRSRTWRAARCRSTGSARLERWRQIRSSRRIAHGERSAELAGASHHVVDAAAGATIYRGIAYPKAFRGNAFVGDAQNNLIHRMKLTPDGPTFKATSVDGDTEFVRSSDNWFRPVNLMNAPDGTLYALDMSREVIEAIHIPLDVVKHLDLVAGRDQGRIYRIAPTGFTPKKPPHLSKATTAELVATLEHPDGWWRDTAHRLLFERQDAAAVGPLRTLATAGKTEVARSSRPLVAARAEGDSGMRC